jgi:hypothetical protein
MSKQLTTTSSLVAHPAKRAKLSHEKKSPSKSSSASATFATSASAASAKADAAAAASLGKAACRLDVHATFAGARTATLTLPHGPVETPVFMPVGTQGTMKGMTPEQVAECGPQIILSNTYHLGSRPGADRVDRLGGLHKMMHWPRNILTGAYYPCCWPWWNRRAILRPLLAYSSSVCCVVELPRRTDALPPRLYHHALVPRARLRRSNDYM